MHLEDARSLLNDRLKVTLSEHARQHGELASHGVIVRLVVVGWQRIQRLLLAPRQG